MKRLIFLLAIPFCLTGCGESPDSPEQAEEIKKYLDEGFGPPMNVSWYPAIQGVQVKGDTVLVNTSLAEKNPSASGICSGTSGYVFSNPNSHLGLKRVKVLGNNGQTLIDRNGISEKCY